MVSKSASSVSRCMDLGRVGQKELTEAGGRLRELAVMANRVICH